VIFKVISLTASLSKYNRII